MLKKISCLCFLSFFINASYAIQPVYTNITNKHKTDCKYTGNIAVFLVLGQSNAANSGKGRYSVNNKVSNIFKGECYIANDPLLGATGNRGSVWGRLSDKLIDNGAYDQIVISSIAVGGSPMISWTQHGKGRVHGNYFTRIIDAIDELKSLNFDITHIFWHQGEQDTSFGTTTDQYIRMFLDMWSGIRELGVDAPIYVARASLCQGRGSEKVIRAQNDLIEEYGDILQGTNTDLINDSKYRIDGGCHFSELGLALHADKWYESMVLNEN